MRRIRGRGRSSRSTSRRMIKQSTRIRLLSSVLRISRTRNVGQMAHRDLGTFKFYRSVGEQLGRRTGRVSQTPHGCPASSARLRGTCSTCISPASSSSSWSSETTRTSARTSARPRPRRSTPPPPFVKPRSPRPPPGPHRPTPSGRGCRASLTSPLRSRTSRRRS